MSDHHTESESHANEIQPIENGMKNAGHCTKDISFFIEHSILSFYEVGLIRPVDILNI